MNPRKLIDAINSSCKKSIDSAFNLSLHNRCNHNLLHFIIDGTSYAVNKHELVKVLKWFDDFWLFLEIKFELQSHTFISLSVFQGKDFDSKKYQLFRAEWDDYDNSDEKHAQPHWHISSNQTIENTFIEYADILEKQDFLHEFESEKQKMIDVKRIHFAMNGDWQRIGGTHIHKMENEQQIVRWLQGMLNHLRAELESV